MDGTVNIGRLLPDNNILLASDDEASCWSRRGDKISSLPNHPSVISALASDKDACLAAVGCTSGSLWLWELQSGKHVGTLPGHRAAITCLEFHPFGSVFVSGSCDTNIKIWDPRQSRCVQTYRGHTSAVTCVQFSPHGRWLASGDEEGNIYLWDLSSGKLLSTCTLSSLCEYVSFHPNDFFLLTGTADGLEIWSCEDPRSLALMARHQMASSHKAVFSTDGTGLWVATTSKSFHRFTWAGSNVKEIESRRVGSVLDVSHDGKLLVLEAGRVSVVNIDAMASEISISSPAAKFHLEERSPSVQRLGKPHRDENRQTVNIGDFDQGAKSDINDISRVKSDLIANRKTLKAEEFVQRKSIRMEDLVHADGISQTANVDDFVQTKSFLEPTKKPKGLSSLLTRRLMYARTICGLWSSGNSKSAIEEAITLYSEDPSIFTSMMIALPSTKIALSIDTCAKILKQIQHVLVNCRPQQFVISALLNAIVFLSRRFESVLRDINKSPSTVSDFSERVSRGRACIALFHELEQLIQNSTVIGRKEKQETLPNIVLIQV